MEGFKKLPKYKCGGSVTKAVEKCGGGRMKEGGKVTHDDVKEDKKLIKKAFNLHDDQKHEGKTDLSSLKKGGRCKKEGGNVRKYADGGLTSPLVQNLVNAEVLRKKRMGQANVPNPAMQAAGAAPAGGMVPAQAPMAPTPQNIGATTGPIMKKGGKVKKGCK